MKQTKRKQFCELGPLAYQLATKKEILRRHLQDLVSKERFAKTKSDTPLPVVLSEHHSGLIKRGPGIDPTLQYNKVTNIELASARMNKTVIRPGETFSFWHLVGKITPRKGYKNGRVLIGGKIVPGIGGGLCNLVNTLHLLVLHSPLDVTEFHSHSDALAPDEGGRRVPFSAGTSISYNSVDYRFKNNTDQDIQLLLWVADEALYGELRGEKDVPVRYELTEEDHHFQKEGEKYYRVSRIYRNTIDKDSGKVLQKDLVLDNHSEVMFDYALIPQEQIR
ncbi:MAG: VanW family protein [Clostridia bacterium]|nr:VanW family protein [Clostridia bacterium]